MRKEMRHHGADKKLHEEKYSERKKSFTERQRLARREDISLEEAARKARYAFFLKTAKRLRIRKIAFAHTQDDQAETVLMRVLQGTGLRGLSGIRRQIEWDGVRMVRPMLDFR